MVVLNVVMVMVEAVGHLYHSPLDVNALRAALEEVAAAKELANRIDYRCQVQIAGCDLMQHGRKHKKVVAVDQCEFEIIRACQLFFEFHSDVEAGEAPAEDHNLLFPAHECLLFSRDRRFRSTP